MAKCAIIGEKQSGWLCGTGCLKVTIDKTKALPFFVYYQLQTPPKIGWIEKYTVGATMPNLNTGIIGQVPIELPTLNSQCEIVSILSAYDNLIDNCRQIKLLEEAAQRLYTTESLGYTTVSLNTTIYLTLFYFSAELFLFKSRFSLTFSLIPVIHDNVATFWSLN